MDIDNFDILLSLDANKMLVFAYLTCERLYPNYVYFSENYKFGNKRVLRDAIDFIYDHLLSSNFSNSLSIFHHLESVNLNTADTEDFETIFVSPALDACTSILETLNFMFDKNPARLKNISTFATDTVDMYVSTIENLDFNTDKLFEQKVFNHPLMQKEINIQKSIISYLFGIKKLNQIDIRNLLELQQNNGKSNINVS